MVVYLILKFKYIGCVDVKLSYVFGVSGNSYEVFGDICFSSILI